MTNGATTDGAEYGPLTTAEEVIDGVDLSGRVAVVTGASGGMGLEIARSFASAGAAVVLCNRNHEKSAAAVDQLLGSVPGATIGEVPLDLASFGSVRECAQRLLETHPRIDLLVNNAGVMVPPELARTEDGMELQFGTNHLGHFLLTGLLLSALRGADGARVVNVTSEGHRLGDIDYDDPNYERREYQPWPAYGQSKTANILFSVELDRRYGDGGLHASSVHPGVVETDLFRHMDPDEESKLKARVQKGGMPIKTPQQGAANAVLAATGDIPRAAYLDDCQVREAADYATDAASAERLWTLSERLVGEAFPA